jgi:hypothetical protein
MARQLGWLLAALTLTVLLTASGAVRGKEPETKTGTIKTVDVEKKIITASYNNEKPTWTCIPPSSGKWTIRIDGQESTLDKLSEILPKVKSGTVKFTVVDSKRDTAYVSEVEAFTK